MYVLATHGIFSGTCSLILQEAGNLEKVRHVLILPTRHYYAIVADCGDQLPSSKRKCGSDGLQDRGHRHIRWDFFSSNHQYLKTTFYFRNGFRVHKTQPLQWVCKTNRKFSTFRIHTFFEGERSVWTLLQADRQGGWTQGEEDQRCRRFIQYPSYPDTPKPPWFQKDHPQLVTLAAAAAPPQDMEMDPEDQEAFNRAQAIRGQRKGFRLESICWD